MARHHRKHTGHHPRTAGVLFSHSRRSTEKEQTKGSCGASSHQYRSTRPGSEVKCLPLLLPTSSQPPSTLYTTSTSNKILLVPKHSADSLRSPHVHRTRGPPLRPSGTYFVSARCSPVFHMVFSCSLVPHYCVSYTYPQSHLPQHGSLPSPGKHHLLRATMSDSSLFLNIY